ncbi:hypothetical protein FRC08_015131, partial [Ceratobasidium sp. 394]
MTSDNCTCGSESAAPTQPLLSSLVGGLLSWVLPPHRPTIPALPYEVYEEFVRSCIDLIVKDLDDFRKLVCREWNSRWPVPPPNKWVVVRPLVYFEQAVLPVDLSSFQRLRFASLNFDNAFEYRDDAWHLLPLVSRLPESLEEIEFLRSHASERDVIHLIRELCPTITTLRLVFCSMFNNPECPWWFGHQEQIGHHYLKTHELSEVDQYATSLARELQDLPRIKRLHLGVYLTPFQAVTDHRVRADHIEHHCAQDSREYIDHINIHNVANFDAEWAAHHQGIPAPDTAIDKLAPLKLWEKPCPVCVDEWTNNSERAERRAASILALHVPTLCSVSFASFVAERRTAPSEWKIQSRVIEYPSTGERV